MVHVTFGTHDICAVHLKLVTLTSCREHIINLISLFSFLLMQGKTLCPFLIIGFLVHAQSLCLVRNSFKLRVCIFNRRCLLISYMVRPVSKFPLQISFHDFEWLRHNISVRKSVEGRVNLILHLSAVPINHPSIKFIFLLLYSVIELLFFPRIQLSSTHIIFIFYFIFKYLMNLAI